MGRNNRMKNDVRRKSRGNGFDIDEIREYAMRMNRLNREKTSVLLNGVLLLFPWATLYALGVLA